jgi:hypothetical protein
LTTFVNREWTNQYDKKVFGLLNKYRHICDINHKLLDWAINLFDSYPTTFWYDIGNTSLRSEIDELWIFHTKIFDRSQTSGFKKRPNIFSVDNRLRIFGEQIWVKIVNSFHRLIFLFKERENETSVCVYVCVCVRGREIECVCMCVCARERERERGSRRSWKSISGARNLRIRGKVCETKKNLSYDEERRK